MTWRKQQHYEVFAWESPRPAALMRIGLGLVLLWDVLGKWPYVVELYSTAGMPMPVFPGSMLEPPSLSAGWAVALHALLVFSLLAVVAGFKTRASLVLAFVLFSWFGLLDFGGTYKKYSVIGQHLLVLMVFTRCHAAWSMDALLDPERRLRTELSPVWPRTLMKVLISCIYLGAVITKIPRPAFGTGDLLTFSLLDVRWGGGRLGMWLSTMPALMMLLSNLTVIFELAAALLLWVPQMRRTMLLLAFGFHAALGISLHIGIFSPMMIVALLAFARESDLQLVRVWFRRLTTGRDGQRRREREAVLSRKRRHGIEWLWYAAAAVVFTALGFAQQYAADDSDVFRGVSPQPWRELDEQTTAEIRNAPVADGTSPAKMQPADYVHRVEIGSRAGNPGNPLLFGSRTEFTRDDLLIAQARTQPRHPQLTLRWKLINPAGDVATTEQTLPPNFTIIRQVFRLSSPNTPPGDYTLVLEAGGDEVARREFRIHE